MTYQGFRPEATAFLQQLKDNGYTKEFFKEHEATYEKEILEPSKAFVIEMGEHLQALVPTINFIAKRNASLFKIYRDVRFSKDKTAIKSRIGIIFWQGRGKRLQQSSFYLHFSADELFFAAGIRWFEKDNLHRYRDYIKDTKNAQALLTILERLKDKGYHIFEPNYKRLPKEFDKSYPYPELAKYGQMAASFSDDINYFYGEALIQRAFMHFENLLELQQWVYAMSSHEIQSR